MEVVGVVAIGVVQTTRTKPGEYTVALSGVDAACPDVPATTIVVRLAYWHQVLADGAPIVLIAAACLRLRVAHPGQWSVA